MFHKKAAADAASLANVMFRKQDTIRLQLSLRARYQAKENRQRLAYIVKTVILCGKQGVAVRNYRERSSITSESEQNGKSF